MKTTFELPDSLFRQAKSAAASSGVSLRELFTQAIADKLGSGKSAEDDKPWMQGFGAFGKGKRGRAETARIQSIIDDEFGKVNAADWS